MEYIIVQAGGKGTRLQKYTKNKPKALLPVDNLPMLFHLFRRFPGKRFIIIADYKREVLKRYLGAFAKEKYLVVETSDSGTCAGVREAVSLVPDNTPFMLIWSDLILPETFCLPDEYGDGMEPKNDYVGISATFPCRWSYDRETFKEEASTEHGVAGFFLFTDKRKLAGVPQSGELVRWMQQEGQTYLEHSLAHTKEFGLIEEYERYEVTKCRPFNRITIDGDTLIKEAIDAQGEQLAAREVAWYRKARQLTITALPKIYEESPLKMEYIKGKNIYECDLDRKQKRHILEQLVGALHALHESDSIPTDHFSLKEAYYTKTMARLAVIRDLVPLAQEREIMVNGRKCRNVLFHTEELEQALSKLTCDAFVFIHGDCTFSNLMLRESGEPVLIDPRGYFGFTELFGDVRYDWAKLYYSVVGNYDQFNLKRFDLDICPDGVHLDIRSNHWEEMEQDFFDLTGADPYEIKLLHAVIWLSLTTYAWQDYDSICGAFYNGLYYLQEVLG